MVAERRANGSRFLEAGTGWPVVLLHAFPLNADMWRPQLERVPSGWHFIAPDLRGSTVEEMASAVLKLLDALHIDGAVIGGLSMGGYVTFALYRLEPARLHGMMLADTRATADTAEARAQRERLIALVRDKGSAAIAEEMLPKLLGKTTLRERHDLQTEVRDMAASVPPQDIEAALTAMLRRPDSTPLLDRISFATLVICGDEDAATPLAEVEQLHQHIPRSRFVVLQGAGHLSNLEKPDEFSLVLTDFLVANI